MNWFTLLHNLRTLNVLPPERLDRTQKILGAATKAAGLTAAVAGSQLEGEVRLLFDELDSLGQNDQTLAAMTLLAEAAEELRGSETAPVAASAGAPASLAARTSRPSLSAASAALAANRRPVRSAGRGAEVLTAAGVPMEPSIAEEMSRVLSRGVRPGSQVLVASVRRTYPTDRQLGTDPLANETVFDAVTGPAALVASGGICNPVDVDYSVPGFSVQDRPIRDALPAFGASRGGIRYMSTPTLAGTQGGITLWTAARDAAVTFPGGVPSDTKPVLTITCPQEVEVLVDAVPLRTKVGNLEGRFSPEIVQATTDLALAQHARFAELNLWTKIVSASTTVSSAQLLGATRDLLATMDLTVAAFRYRHRLGRDTKFRAILPDFALDMLRADMTRELANDNDTTTMRLSDSDVTELITARGITPVFALDGFPAQSTGITYPAQGFAAQTTGALLDWPRQLAFTIFPEGTFSYLDGGELTVSVIRDSVLDSTNDYETLTEVFESVAFRGVESLHVVASVRPNGGSAGTIATASY